MSEHPQNVRPPPRPRHYHEEDSPMLRKVASDDGFPKATYIGQDASAKAPFPQDDPIQSSKRHGVQRKAHVAANASISEWHLELMPTHQRLYNPFGDNTNLVRLGFPLGGPGVRRHKTAYFLAPNAVVLEVEHGGQTKSLYFTGGVVKVEDIRSSVAAHLRCDPLNVSLWYDGIYLNEDLLSLKDIAPNYDSIVPIFRTSEAEPSNWYGLHFALQWINHDSVRSFLDRTGNFEVLENRTNGWTPLLVGARMCRNTSLLKKRHLLSNEHDAQKDSLSQYYRTMKFLLERGANPNASRNGRDSLLEVAEGGDKNTFVLLLAYGADSSKTEAFCHGSVPISTKSRIEAWLSPWNALCPIGSLPNLGAVYEDLEDDLRELLSQTIAMDWEVPLVVERIKSLNPEKSAYDCLRDEVVLIWYEKGPSGESSTGGFEATTCGEFVRRRWPSLRQMLLADIAVRCSPQGSGNETGQWYFSNIVSNEKCRACRKRSVISCQGIGQRISHSPMNTSNSFSVLEAPSLVSLSNLVLQGGLYSEFYRESVTAAV
jgi:hypothetical protein